MGLRFWFHCFDLLSWWVCWVLRRWIMGWSAVGRSVWSVTPVDGLIHLMGLIFFFTWVWFIWFWMICSWMKSSLGFFFYKNRRSFWVDDWYWYKFFQKKKKLMNPSVLRVYCSVSAFCVSALFISAFCACSVAWVPAGIKTQTQVDAGNVESKQTLHLIRWHRINSNCFHFIYV